jgi:group I intron endonuclease
MYFIYEYKHMDTGRVYIGYTGDLVKRDKAHSEPSRKIQHIDRAIQKYGRDQFGFMALEAHDTKEEALVAEIRMIAFMKELLGEDMMFNHTNGGEGGGAAHTEETKKKISISNIGRKHTENSRKNMSEAHRGKIPWIKGKKHTEETKQKMSKSQKCRTLKKLSEYF